MPPPKPNAAVIAAMPSAAHREYSIVRAQRDALLAAAKEALAWNAADLRGIEDITPNEEMLRARAKVLRSAIRKAVQS